MTSYELKPEVIETIFENPLFKENIVKLIAETLKDCFEKELKAQNISVSVAEPKVDISKAVSEGIIKIARERMGLKNISDLGVTARKASEALNKTALSSGFLQSHDPLIDSEIFNNLAFGGYTQNQNFNLTHVSIVDPAKDTCGMSSTTSAEKAMQNEQLKQVPAQMINVLEGYQPLAEVLALALEQAQNGKGNERHQVGKTPFIEQPICSLARLFGVGYNFGQASKKAHETQQLVGTKAKQAELLGAINYLAAAYLVLSEQE